MKETITYDELDPPVVKLCRALNAIDGIRTLGSCGGHEDGECPPEQWRVTFLPDTRRDGTPTKRGWLGLEWVAWVVYSAGWTTGHVDLVCHALPPFLNTPGRMLKFDIYGNRPGIEPDHLADFLTEAANQVGGPGAGTPGRGRKLRATIPDLFRHSRISLPGK